MSQDISVFGGVVTLLAIPTYPVAIPLTEFADDTDPFDLPELEIAQTAMGNNGDMLTWSTAKVIQITLGIIPGGIDDEILAVLLENNRVGKGKLLTTRDKITLTCLYPDGKFINLVDGKLVKGSPASSAGSNGRLKSKTYTFEFGNKIGS